MVRTFHWCLVLICVILIGSEHWAKARLTQAPELVFVTVRKIWSTVLVMSGEFVLVPVIRSKGGYRDTSLKGNLRLFFNHFL